MAIKNIPTNSTVGEEDHPSSVNEWELDSHFASCLKQAANKRSERDGSKTLKSGEQQATPLIHLRKLFLTIRIPATPGLRAVNNPCLETGGILFLDLDGPDQIKFYHLGAVNPHILSLLSNLFYKHVEILLTKIIFIFLVPYSSTSCTFYKKLSCKALIPFIGVSPNQ
jgi:hypothetical protein